MTTTQLERRNKAFAPTTFKAAGQDDGSGGTLKDGEFIALAAVFGNIDSYGERIQPGAFTQTLADWEAKGDPIPIIWQHNWADPEAHIGYVLAIEETDEGLLYKGVLDLDEPFAAKVYRLMKGRRVTQQSIGFDIRDAAEAKVDDQWVFDILRVDLHEVGPCLLGVNRATDLIDIKSDGTPREGRRIERSGQEESPAAEATSASTSSDSEPTSAKSAGFSPASVGLLISTLEMSIPLED
jgi:HK97 family phage prohead protease